jgi:ArsR family transcriptional regulator, arsenate/arsenite/antimonite-responsive transcriptional repressor
MDDTSLVRVLKALADPHRFKMVQEIAAAGELSCGQVGECFQLAQPTISHHIKILAEAGLVAVRREGQHIFISLDRALLDRVLGMLPGRLEGAKPVKAARKGRS